MQTIDMALEKLLIAKTITPDVALEKAQDKDSFARVADRFR